MQHFDFKGKFDFSPETLRLFLEGKQIDVAAPKILPWKSIVMYIQSRTATGAHGQISKLVSEKKAEGMGVDVSFEHEQKYTYETR